MSELLTQNMQKREITGILIAALCFFLSECNQKPIDRSGFEIFSIIPSEIKRFQYYDDTFMLDATRKLKNTKTFNIKAVNKKTGITANLSQSGEEFNILLERFSTFRNVKKIKIDSNAYVHVLAGITFEDYSILEPAEFTFLMKDSYIYLEREKNEYYTVDIPMSEFQKLNQFCIDGIRSQK